MFDSFGKTAISVVEEERKTANLFGRGPSKEGKKKEKLTF
jgi:hypothetical protein